MTVPAQVLKQAGVGSALELRLLVRIRAYGLPEPARQFKAVPTRRWKWDFAWPQYRVLVEVQGAVWQQGRHTRGHGYGKDREKSATAQLLGFLALEFTSDQVDSGVAVEMIAAALRQRGWEG